MNVGNILVRVYSAHEINAARDRMRVHFEDADVLVGVVSAGDVATGLYVYGTEEGPRSTEGVPVQYTTNRCSVCRAPQFQTPHGATCGNGHGGAPPL